LANLALSAREQDQKQVHEDVELKLVARKEQRFKFKSNEQRCVFEQNKNYVLKTFLSHPLNIRQ
jgi:hypothetical protein